MIVVSDTSPVTALLTGGHAELLRQLFGEVVIPPAVKPNWSGPTRICWSGCKPRAARPGAGTSLWAYRRPRRSRGDRACSLLSYSRSFASFPGSAYSVAAEPRGKSGGYQISANFDFPRICS